MIRCGFERMELNRIEARCNLENTGSARVMEQAGMCAILRREREG